MSDSRSSVDLAPSKSYASALSSVSQNEPALLNNSAPKDDIQVMQLIPPLSKDTVSSSQKLQMAFNDCALAILVQFPDFVKDKITITQSFTKTRAEKTLHSISVISPAAARPYYDHIRSQGILLLGKTVFPTGKYHLNPNRSFYPRKVNVKFSNLPYVCDDVSALKIIDLPSNIQRDSAITREQVKLNNNSFYTGRGVLKVTLKNKEEEDQMRIWSKRTKMAGPIDWNGILISSHSPSLHECTFCKEQNLPAVGHDVEWCFKAQKANDEKDTDTNVSDKRHHATPDEVNDESLFESEDNAIETEAQTRQNRNDDTENDHSKNDDNQKNDSANDNTNDVIAEAITSNEENTALPQLSTSVQLLFGNAPSNKENVLEKDNECTFSEAFVHTQDHEENDNNLSQALNNFRKQQNLAKLQNTVSKVQKSTVNKNKNRRKTRRISPLSQTSWRKPNTRNTFTKPKFPDRDGPQNIV